MPTNRSRRARQRRSAQRVDLDEHLAKAICDGHFLFDDQQTEDFQRGVWEQHGEQVMEEFINAHPGCRPWCWWRLEAPERARRMLNTPRYQPSSDDIYQMKGYRVATADPDKWAASWTEINNFGLPHMIWNKDSPYFESEADFLERHDLLTIDEKIALAKAEEAAQ